MSTVSGLTASSLSTPSSPSTPPIDSASREAVYCFAIHAQAEPGVMPRVLELLAKRGLIPLRWHADRVGPDQAELAIDMQVTGLERATSDYIARCLRQIYGVETVLTSEKMQG